MRPQNSLILVKYEEKKEKKTEAGIFIPEASQDNALSFLRSGEVLAINKKEEEEGEIKVGDHVLFNKNAICYIPTVKDEILVRKEDIYGII